ncbi:MAG: helix-turn-helix transcriptional regulator [Desulfobacterales bacterium]|jgi:poly-beta-hydroxybutyrate-responsive repressor|nr:helix-turn-helix transcriptional regulator [Desulfobacteraceae bacterium]MDY0311165.1 helix-turn-helix transcriptional regulator [Desulfobacterales bacterium]
MSTQKKSSRSTPGSGKRERYIQPSILMGLFHRPTYGYELIQTIQRFGFVEGPAAPGMIYRHLRQMEDDGWVASRWQTEGVGPARRIYTITDDGREVLALWIAHMDAQAGLLKNFVTAYRQAAAASESPQGDD